MPENACVQFQYAVKFVCGEADERGIVAPGQYFTAINIHNPSSTRPVKFQWKIAIAPPGVKGGPISKFFDAGLKPDQALEIDCPDITRRSPGVEFKPLKGFVVILSPCELDVVAVYTAQAKRGAPVQTMHTERVPPRVTCC
jgi:hypothetical protein